ncbi:MAG: efflux RND transporter periplasmic adaptor subunit [Terracidiphilus sp.]|nr:efflux RND transporter periplasmic adaptor subunit [Terracidiphilus sp.]
MNHIENNSDKNQPRKEGASRALKVVAIGGVLLLLAGVAFGMYQRSAQGKTLAAETEKSAALPVHVLRPAPDGNVQEISLPGNTQGFNDTPIYARTNGYIKRWYVDIGAQVKSGQLLAEIATPEVDRELEQARGDLKTARANADMAQITATRWQKMLEKNAVSRQETDQAVSDMNARRAAVESMQANVQRLEQLQSFERVYAPFSGVITARNVDIGTLIASGPTGETKELFHLAAAGRIRVYVSVPEAQVNFIQPETRVYLTLDEYPGQHIEGTIARDAHAIDQASRTLNVEVDVNNADKKLRPGAYVLAHFENPKHVTQQKSSLMIPANALLFRAEGPTVGIARNGKAELRPVVIGHDFGSTLEIVQGIAPNDQVILHPSDSLTNGTAIQVVSVQDGRTK